MSISPLNFVLFLASLVTVKYAVDVSIEEFPRINFCNSDADDNDAKKEVSEACGILNDGYDGVCYELYLPLIEKHAAEDVSKSVIPEGQNPPPSDLLSKTAKDDSESSTSVGLERKSFDFDKYSKHKIGLCFDMNGELRNCITKHTTSMTLLVWKYILTKGILAPAHCIPEKVIEKPKPIDVHFENFSRMNFCNNVSHADDDEARSILQEAQNEVSAACKILNIDYSGTCHEVNVLLIGEHAAEGQNPKPSDSISKTATANDDSKTSTSIGLERKSSDSGRLPKRKIGVCYDSLGVTQNCISKDTTEMKLLVWKFTLDDSDTTVANCIPKKIIDKSKFPNPVGLGLLKYVDV